MEQITDKIKKLKKIKLRFNLPTPKKILLYEDMHASILKKIINKDFNIIKVRENKEIYFWILIKQIIFFDFTFNTYCKNFIKFTSPSIIITFIDNNIQFYKFKKKFKNITFISIQNGLRDIKWFKSKIVKKSDKLKCDHMFVLNKYYIKEYQKIIKSKYHVLGGFKNNIVKINKTKIFDNYLFISQFNKHRRHNNSFRNKLLNLINIFLNSYNKKLHILLRHSNYLKQREEIQYYKKIFQSKCIFHKQSDWKKSYEIVDKFENIIFMYSTLGYEAFARKKKVAIFSPKKNYGFQYNFGWSALTQKKYNFFSAKNLTYNEIKRVLSNVNKCSQMHWEKTYYSAIKDQLYFNKNNTKIKQIISKIV